MRLPAWVGENCEGGAASGDSRGTEVCVDSIVHRFGDYQALRGVNLRVEPGEFVTLLGPSGSGKTTLLRIIAGLLQPTEGRVYVDGRDVTRLPPEKRSMGFVFQNYALFPHMSVFENVAFPLKVRKVPGGEVKQRVAAALHLVQLSGLEKRYPSQLSGGQQQRVALARAIVFRPTVLLMDEPLGSLDKRLRQELQIEVRHLQKEVGITTIYVTHDQEEAFSMSDRIVVMNHGTVLQVATPAEVYNNPSDAFVAHFVGDLNYFRGDLVVASGETGVLRTADGLEFPVQLSGVDAGTRRLVCGIRPERIQLGTQVNTEVRFQATLRTLTFMGTHFWAQARLPTGDMVIAQLSQQAPDLKEGDAIWIGWNVSQAHVFALRTPGGESDEMTEPSEEDHLARRRT